MALTRMSSAVTLNHMGHDINGHQELTNYLNSLSTMQERHEAIRQFRDQIMNLHARIEDLVYGFVDFLNRDPLYAGLTIEGEEEAIII